MTMIALMFRRIHIAPLRNSNTAFHSYVSFANYVYILYTVVKNINVMAVQSFQ